MRFIPSPGGALLLLAFLSVPLQAQRPDGYPPVDPGADRAGESFVIRPGDVLRIHVWPDTALSGDFRVEENGDVFLPALGRFAAAGLSLPDLRRGLRSAYGEAMKMPVVTVVPIFRVAVIGAVQRPGVYEVDPDLTLLDAVGLAGGFTDRARADRVKVLRGDRVIELDLETWRLGAAETALRSGDRIIVPARSRWFTLDSLLRVTQIAVSVATLVLITAQR